MSENNVEINTKIWPENPSEEDVREISNKFEDFCAINEKDPKIESKQLEVMTHFLFNQGFTEEEDTMMYSRVIENEMEKRYPKESQIEMDFS